MSKPTFGAIREPGSVSIKGAPHTAAPPKQQQPQQATPMKRAMLVKALQRMK